MSSLVFELGCNEILSPDIAVNLRKYITLRNPGLSPASRAGIFADAVNRIVDGRLPKFDASVSKSLKNLLFRDIASKPLFSIDCADVFQSAVRLKTLGPEFFRELNAWVSEAVNRTVAKESLFGMVINARKLIDTIPGDKIVAYFESVERNIGGIKYIEMDLDYDIVETEAVSDILSGVASVELANGSDAFEFIPAPVARAIRRKPGFLDALRHRILLFQPGIVITTSAAAVMLSFMLFTGNDRNYVTENNYSPARELIPAEAASQTVPYESAMQVDSTSVNDVVTIRMKATAYDLSFKSCGKMPGDPAYGITNSGTRAIVGRTVAVDPHVIPLGTQLYITFPNEYSDLDGYYVAEDTGSLIKGNDIDIFFGEDRDGSHVIHDKAMDFGIRYVDVKVINQDAADTDE